MIFEITQVLSWSEKFRDIYGMRFVGLADPTNSVYITYSVPDREAPYPQDFVIDQDGVVRHWSWEYDPVELIATIDRLLATTGVEGTEDRPGPDERPAGLWLASPTPNPFRTGTELLFRLSAPAPYRMTVYDPAGRVIRTLAGRAEAAGEHVVSWDGRDRHGRPAVSGVYFIVLSTQGREQARRAVLLR